jgi:hypothetical protein
MEDHGIPLEDLPGDRPLEPVRDDRRRMEEPLPVKLVAVADVEAEMLAEDRQEMDILYVSLLEFAKDYSDKDVTVYRADNFRLIVRVKEGPIERADYRPITVEVRSLAEVEQRLAAAEIEYERHRGVLPGSESLLLRDKGGNWVEIVEARQIR